MTPESKHLGMHKFQFNSRFLIIEKVEISIDSPGIILSLVSLPLKS